MQVNNFTLKNKLIGVNDTSSSGFKELTAVTNFIGVFINPVCINSVLPFGRS